MRRLFILLLIFATLFISGCFNELSSEDSSVLESQFVSTIMSELTASKDVSEVNLTGDGSKPLKKTERSCKNNKNVVK